jgi:hypothetical protein
MSGGGGPGAAGWFFGCLLIVMGALLAVFCGGCTLLFWVGSLGSGGSLNDESGILVLSFVLGGIPALGGIGLIIAGVAIIRGGRKRRPPAS